MPRGRGDLRVGALGRGQHLVPAHRREEVTRIRVKSRCKHSGLVRQGPPNLQLSVAVLWLDDRWHEALNRLLIVDIASLVTLQLLLDEDQHLAGLASLFPLLNFECIPEYFVVVCR